MRLTSKEVFDLTKDSIVHRKPYSAIRLGDGEGRVMGFPSSVSIFDMAQIWEIWFGHSQFTEYQVNFVKQGLIEACRSADVVGLPIVPPNKFTDFGRVEVFFEEFGYKSNTTKIANSGFHLDWEHENLYINLLSGLQHVGVVGSRDVRSALAERYGISSVHWVSVPTEMRYSTLSQQEKIEEILFRPHLFARFRDTWEFGIPSILSQNEGAVVLVGAGILGKLYCARIKQLGGIAIDVGSMMDLWAGLKTRAMPMFEGLTDLTK